MIPITLPYQFEPYPYQLETFKAFFQDGYRRFIDIEHRRAGKDKKWLNIICAAAHQRVGIYLHALPKLNQARKVIWKGIDSEGKSFLSHFPRELIARVDNTEMSIEFKNGSIYRLGGSDNFDSWMGTNPVGIVFSEYALQDPAAWDYFRPIIVENGGWAAFIYTPRGKNHGYKLYQKNSKNPKWFIQYLPVSCTTDNNGKPIIQEEEIEEERKAGMMEEMIQQEFYCSFSSAILGAYYAKEMKLAYDENRIYDFPIETNLPVYTFWDLGINDTTFIWFMQKYMNEFRFIHCYESSGEGLQHYINYLHDFRDKNQITSASHYAPHDIGVRELTSGKRRIDTAYELGIKFEMVVRAKNLVDDINSTRIILKKCFFRPSSCERGLRCLMEYTKEWDERNKVFKNHPKHDWTSHGADAFRIFASSGVDNKSRGGIKVFHNCVNPSRI